MSIVVEPASQRLLTILDADLPQSVLLSGLPGVGLLTIATSLAKARLAATLRPQDSKEHVDNQNGSITVEMIRKLYDQTRAKHTTRQIIIIDDADRMTRGAQSAFLKLLEEPTTSTHFILTSHQPDRLLPTIRSRVQHTVIQPLSLQQSATFIASLNIQDPVKQTRLRFLADRLPAELVRLTQDEEYFKACAAIVGDARSFLQADAYTKMLIIQKYRGDRDKALRLVESTIQLLRRSVSAKPQHAAILQLNRLLEVQEHLLSNYNVSLQLMQFVL